MKGRWSRFKLGKRLADVDRALRYVVRAAYRDVPVYKKRWSEAACNPLNVGGREDLALLPITTKAQLLSEYPSGAVRRDVDPAKCHSRFTSGSTGLPFAVLYSTSERWFRKAALLRAFARCVRLPWPLRITEVGTGPNQRPQPRGPLREVSSAGLAKLRPFTIERVSRMDAVARQADQLRAARAHVVTGHPSLLELIAGELVQRGGDWDRPRIVISRGEVLTADARALFARAFGCPVVDFYNCEEIGNISWQCPEHGDRMHVNHDLCWLEAVDDDGRVVGDGAAGRVVVTSLYNVTMPFVRYLLDDQVAIVSRGRCACGYAGTTLSLVQGRAEEFVVLPNGERRSPRVVDSLVATAVLGGPAKVDRLELRGVLRYQIVQEAPDRFTVRVLAPPSVRAALPGAIQTALAGLDPTIRCAVEFVDDLPLEPSGKRRAIISRVSEKDP